MGAIATVATLLYLATQIRQNTEQQKRDATVAIQHGQNDVIALFEDPSAARAYSKTAEYGLGAAVEDRIRAQNFVLRYLNHFQIVYDMHRDGTLDEERYQLWEGFAVAIVAPKGIRQWWDDESGKLGFMSEVRNLIDRKLADENDPPVPITEMWSTFAAESWERPA